VHALLVGFAGGGLAVRVGVPHADEGGHPGGRGAARRDEFLDTQCAVLEMDLGQQRVRGRAGRLVDPDDAGRVVEAAEQ